MKTGDRIRLRTLESIKTDQGNKIDMKHSGFYTNGSFINQSMFHMFGKEWTITKCYDNRRIGAMYHFEIYDKDAKFSWSFCKSWVEDNIIGINVDELFAEIEI